MYLRISSKLVLITLYNVHCIRLSTHGFSLCCDLRVRVIVERALESSFQALKIDGSLDGLFNQPSPYALYVPVPHVIFF